MKLGKIIILLLATIAISLHVTEVNAQSERKHIRSGNRHYMRAYEDTTQVNKEEYSKAEVEYRRAIDKRPDELMWKYNLGNSLFKQENYEKAQELYEEVASLSQDKEDKSKAYHNLGNSLIAKQKLDEAIAAYKKALHNNPSDIETQYNLLAAMKKKEQQEQEQQEQEDQQDQNQDKENQDQQEQEKKDQENKDEQGQDKEDESGQNQKDENEGKQDQQKQPEPQKISEENAERILQALQKDEEEIQEKVKKAQALKAEQRKTDKDW